jgi:hypothetical protein
MIVDLTEPERLALAYVARREIEPNRYPLAPQLEPLKSAIASATAMPLAVEPSRLTSRQRV